MKSIELFAGIAALVAAMLQIVHDGIDVEQGDFRVGPEVIVRVE
jgi:hypothetical protein